MIKEQHKEELSNIILLNKWGLSGILPNGNIVDRRLHPDSIPISKNEMMGVSEPATLHKCKDCGNIEREQDLEWNKDISMSHCPKCKSENLDEL